MLTAVHVVSVCRVCVRLPQSPISAEDTYRRDWEAYVEVCLERRRAIAMVPGLPQLPMAERHRLGHKSKEGVLTPTTRCALLCLRLTCPVAATCLVPHRADELPCPVRSLLPRVDARSVVPVWCAPALSAVCLCSLLTSFVLCLLRSAVRGIAAMTTTVHFVRFCGPAPLSGQTAVVPKQWDQWGHPPGYEAREPRERAWTLLERKQLWRRVQIPSRMLPQPPGVPGPPSPEVRCGDRTGHTFCF